MLNKNLYLLRNILQDQYDSDNIDFNQLETITSSIIADDDFDVPPNSLQDAVYYIDMHELENIKKPEILEQIEIIGRFLNETK